MDLRKPSGLYFVLTGLIVAFLGLTDVSRPALTDANVNLYAGLVMLVFGGTLLWLSRRTS